jgi:hypothetical protein
MILTIKQSARWRRKVVPSGHPEPGSISKGSSQVENQTSLKTTALPGERELITAEYDELIRWVDNKGQFT